MDDIPKIALEAWRLKPYNQSEESWQRFTHALVNESLKTPEGQALHKLAYRSIRVDPKNVPRSHERRIDTALVAVDFALIAFVGRMQEIADARDWSRPTVGQEDKILHTLRRLEDRWCNLIRNDIITLSNSAQQEVGLWVPDLSTEPPMGLVYRHNDLPPSLIAVMNTIGVSIPSPEGLEQAYEFTRHENALIAAAQTKPKPGDEQLELVAAYKFFSEERERLGRYARGETESFGDLPAIACWLGMSPSAPLPAEFTDAKSSGKLRPALKWLGLGFYLSATAAKATIDPGAVRSNESTSAVRFRAYRATHKRTLHERLSHRDARLTGPESNPSKTLLLTCMAEIDRLTTAAALRMAAQCALDERLAVKEHERTTQLSRGTWDRAHARIDKWNGGIINARSDESYGALVLASEILRIEFDTERAILRAPSLTFLKQIAFPDLRPDRNDGPTPQPVRISASVSRNVGRDRPSGASEIPPLDF